MSLSFRDKVHILNKLALEAYAIFNSPACGRTSREEISKVLLCVAIASTTEPFGEYVPDNDTIEELADEVANFVAEWKKENAYRRVPARA